MAVSLRACPAAARGAPVSRNAAASPIMARLAPKLHLQHAITLESTHRDSSDRKLVRTNYTSRANPGQAPVSSLDEAIVEEIMQPDPVTCKPDITCKQAARMLLDADVFVGAFDLLISLRDNAQIQVEIEKILARCVKDAMSKRPVSIGPSQPLSEAARVMLANKVHCLPVVDEDGVVVGTLSQHDILRGMVAEHLPLL